MSNRFFITLLVVIAVIFGIFFVTKQKDNNSTGETNGAQPTSHIKSEGSSGVVLIEYGDFECSACFSYEPLVREIVKKYEGQITFQFRNFPISQLHPNAVAAHRWAEAASKQGKFWEMHDLLFDNAHQIGENGRPVPIQWAATTKPQSFFDQYAGQLGLNLEQMKADAASSEVNSIINADVAEGQKIGVTGTPTFVLDGVKIETPNSIEAFYQLIDEAIAKKTKQ